eukprot:m51a1_g14379 hypothetical protein (451) ;mRNA; f:281510-283230
MPLNLVRPHSKAASLASSRASQGSSESITALVALLSIAPIVILWTISNRELSDTASRSIEAQAQSYRQVVVQRAVDNVQVLLLQPGTMTGILRLQTPPSVFNGSVYENLDLLHFAFVPMRLNFPSFFGINVAWTNIRGMHMYGQAKSFYNVKQAPEYVVFDSEVSPDLSLLKYANGTVPTSVLSRMNKNFNVTSRSWWVRGLSHNVNGIAWTGPYLSTVVEEGALLSYTLLLPHPDPRYHSMLMCSISTTWLGSFFAKMKTTQNGWSFLLNYDRELVAASSGIPTMNVSTLLPIKATNSPNISVREVTSSWLARCNGIMCESHYVTGDMFVDASVAAENGGLSWWIVLVTPRSDFLGEVEAQNEEARRSTTVTVAIVASASAAMAMVAIAAAITLSLRIVRPLADVTKQMHQYVPMSVVKSLVRNKLRPAVGVKEMEATILVLEQPYLPY